MDSVAPAPLSVVTATCPVRHWIVDGWCKPIDLGGIPERHADVWEARHESSLDRGRRTSRALGRFPEIEPLVKRLRDDDTILAWRDRIPYALCDDPELHAGGVQVIEPGGWLGTHLGYDRHPKIHMLRQAVSLTVFLNPEWRDEWGGALELCDPMGVRKATIPPKPGRLVAFEAGDLSYHRVAAVTGPVPRVTAAVCYLSVAGGMNTRRRALFLPPDRS